MLSDTSGIAGLVAAHRAGVVAPRTLAGCVEAIGRLRSDFEVYAGNARTMAERCFDIEDFYSAYATLYARVASPRKDKTVTAITEPQTEPDNIPGSHQPN
jgi:hypothetical protein